MVRKRKNSEEETVVLRSRGTRQRRTIVDKTDSGSTMIKGSRKSPKTPKTPSTERRSTRKSTLSKNEDAVMSTRSRRLNPLKSLNNSNDKNTLEDSPDKLIQSKATAKDPLSVASYLTRLRMRKENNENADETSLPEPKKQTRKRKKTLSELDNTLKEKENSGIFKTPVKLTRSQAKTELSRINQTVDEDGKWSEENKRQLDIEGTLESKSKPLRKAANTPKEVLVEKETNSSLNLTSGTITPQSSPIMVNLTPHRSTKTPKKSPMNIGSPKTHSQSPLRLSKTPRKLTVSVESPATSDKSSSSISQSTPAVTSAEINNSGPFVMLTDFVKENHETKQSPKSDQNLETTTKFLSVPKLKFDKPSQNSKSSSSKKSPPHGSRKSRRTSPSKSPIKKLSTPASKIRKSPLKTPNSVSRRTPTNAKRTALINPESPRRPKSSVKKRSPITSSGTPLRPISKNDSPTVKSVTVTASPCLSYPKTNRGLLDFDQTTSAVTPRSRIRRSLHLTPDFSRTSTVSTSSPIPENTAGNLPLAVGISEESKQIDEESLIQLVDSSDDLFDSGTPTATDGTYELSKESFTTHSKEVEVQLEKTEEENATYEVAEPKTPTFQRRSRKRVLSNMDTTFCTPEAKKRCRVRFASPAEKSATKTPAVTASSVRKSLPTVHTPAKQPVKPNRSAVLLRTKTDDSALRRRSRSLTKIDERNSNLLSGTKKRSISASDVSRKTPKLSQATQNSVNRLSKPRQSITSESKLEIKGSVPRKAPNFAQIHQKKFAQMESIVDAKQRVAKRHLELNTAASSSSPRPPKTPVPEIPSQPVSKKVPEPTDTQNGVFNRFGFKLRKTEAMKVINKKPSTAGRNKSQQEAKRTVLKGVRTNRRFELQMKARNINL